MAQAMVATAARAPSISRRMKPTSSKSGAIQTGGSSLRFRRAIGRSEAGEASKTFAQSEQAELLLEDPRLGALGMFEMLQLIVGQEPSALVVVLRHVAVSDEQHVAFGEERDVRNQCVGPAFGFQWETSLAASSPTDRGPVASNLLLHEGRAVRGRSYRSEAGASAYRAWRACISIEN